MNAMFDLPYNSELELNVTTKSTKQTGPGAIFNLSRKNFRRMGASLNLELKGSYEWQTSSTVDGDKSVMNSYELGAALSLEFLALYFHGYATALTRSASRRKRTSRFMPNR